MALPMMDLVVESGGVPVLSIVLLIVGFGLIIAEFFIPGFGICGILGIVCLIADVFVSAKTFTQGLILFSGIVVVLGFLIWLFIYLASKGILPTKLVLSAATSSEQGFDSARDYSALEGADGIALTVLRPVGEAEIRGRRYDVVTQGEYLEKGTMIKVVETEGNRITVEKHDV
jgi:membrane-bound ClpP family serine protease